MHCRRIPGCEPGSTIPSGVQVEPDLCSVDSEKRPGHQLHCVCFAVWTTNFFFFFFLKVDRLQVHPANGKVRREPLLSVSPSL